MNRLLGVVICRAADVAVTVSKLGGRSMSKRLILKIAVVTLFLISAPQPVAQMPVGGMKNFHLYY
jgi:hypothetical protein